MATGARSSLDPSGFFSKPPDRPSAWPSPVATPAPTGTTPGRLWIRYFARMLDIAIAAMVFGFILGLLFPKALGMPSALLGLLIVFAWIFVETALLASWGTTPGKWLLGVGVRTAAGAKLSAGAALRRSFDVWLRGLGGGIPLVSLLTTVKAYKRLKERRQTAWDAAGSFVVSHEPLRAVRIVLAVLLLLVWAGLVVVGSQS